MANKSESKSKHKTFTPTNESCPSVVLNGHQLPQTVSIKYFEIHIDRSLNHIFMKSKLLGLKQSKFLWLIRRKSKLSFVYKLII